MTVTISRCFPTPNLSKIVTAKDAESSPPGHEARLKAAVVCRGVSTAEEVPPNIPLRRQILLGRDAGQGVAQKHVDRGPRLDRLRAELGDIIRA